MALPLKVAAAVRRAGRGWSKKTGGGRGGSLIEVVFLFCFFLFFEVRKRGRFCHTPRTLWLLCFATSCDHLSPEPCPALLHDAIGSRLLTCFKKHRENPNPERRRLAKNESPSPLLASLCWMSRFYYKIEAEISFQRRFSQDRNNTQNWREPGWLRNRPYIWWLRAAAAASRATERDRYHQARCSPCLV